VGDEANHTTARKIWASINHSILSGQGGEGKRKPFLKNDCFVLICVVHKQILNFKISQAHGHRERKIEREGFSLLHSPETAVFVNLSDKTVNIF
jgi:hypothetical protein